MTCTDRSPFIFNNSSAHDGFVKGLLSRKSNPGSPTPANSKSEPFPEYKKGTETILFVDDMEYLRNVFSESLEQLGYRVLTAGTGEEALTVSSAYKGEIHLLLTDVMLPQMKGPELALKLQAERPNIKVIYISGYASGIVAPHGALEPGTVILFKPFTIKVLASKLREVLDQ